MKQRKQHSRSFLFLAASMGTVLVAIVLNSLFQGGFMDYSKYIGEVVNGVLVTQDNYQILQAKLQTEVWTENIVLVAIALLGASSSIPYGIELTKLRTTPDGKPGKYQDSLMKYFSVYNQVVERISSFSVWHQKRYLEELRAKHVKHLLNFGISQAEYILQLDRREVKTLDKPQVFEINGERIFLKSLSKLQIEECLYVLDGRVKLKKIADSYFLNPEGSSTSTFYEQASKEKREATMNIAVMLLFRVMMTVILFSIISYTAVDFINASDKAQVTRAVVKMLSRISNLTMSVFWGITIGQDHVYHTVNFIDGRTSYLRDFKNDKEFTFSDQDIAKAEFKKRVLDENRQITMKEVNTNEPETKVLD